MKLGRIVYLGELFTIFQQEFQELVSGKLDLVGAYRRSRSVARVLRQIGETAAELADAIEDDAAKLTILAGRLGC